MKIESKNNHFERKHYLSRVNPNLGSVKAIRSSRVQDGTWSPQSMSSSSSGENEASFESGNTELNPAAIKRIRSCCQIAFNLPLNSSICLAIPVWRQKSSIKSM